MLVKYTPMERLQLCYIELESLEIELDRQLGEERISNRRVLKASSTTKYKISIVKRNIYNLERHVNGKAENWENWNANRVALQTRMDVAQRDVWTLEDTITSRQSELVALITVDTIENQVRLTAASAEFSRLNKELLEAKKVLTRIEQELVRIVKKEPARVSRIGRDSIMQALEVKDRVQIPRALEPIATQAREKTLGDLEYEALMRGEKLDLGLDITPTNDVGYKPLDVDDDVSYYKPKTEGDTDVSFMFKGFKPDVIEESNETLQSEGTSVGVSCEDTPLDTSDDKHD